MRLYTIILLFFLPGSLKAQYADTLELKVINISSERQELFSHGKNVIKVDSSIQHFSPAQTLSEALQLSTPAFVKTYGAGGSATLTVRGTEPRHNIVTWNGFTINSPTLGLADYSIIPSMLADKILFIPGGSGPVNGNAALGSVTVLEYMPFTYRKSSRITLHSEFGSFGSKQLQSQIEFGGKKLASRTGIFYNEAKNNFKFKNIAIRNQPEMRLDHSAVNSYGIRQVIGIQIAASHELTLSGWYQVNAREIPPLMTTPESFAEQLDSNLRTTAAYKFMSRRSVVNVKAAYFSEFQKYDDEKINLHVDYDVTSYLSDVEWRYSLTNKIIISSGTGYTLAEANFKEYNGLRKREILQFYTGMLYAYSENWHFNVNIRKEFVNASQPPVIPSAGVDGRIIPNARLKANVGMHYNLPAMNELYWIPGGNRSLLPEKAYSIEAGFVLLEELRTAPVISVTSYFTRTNNWIRWQQGAGGIYSPDNLREVTAKGIEASLQWKATFRKVQINASAHYAYSESVTSASHDDLNREILNKQLVYIPRHMGSSILKFSLNKLSLLIIHQYTGKRFTTSDHTDWLEVHFNADYLIEKIFLINDYHLGVYLKSTNTYNSGYQVLAYRPAPPRGFYAGLKFQFHHTK